MKMKRNTPRNILLLFFFFYLPGFYLMLNFTNYKELAGGLLFLTIGLIMSYGTFHPKSILFERLKDCI